MNNVKVNIGKNTELKTSAKFPCPKCSGPTTVIDTLGFTTVGLNRRRKCRTCGTLFYTSERLTQVQASNPAEAGA